MFPTLRLFTKAGRLGLSSKPSLFRTTLCRVSVQTCRHKTSFAPKPIPVHPKYASKEGKRFVMPPRLMIYHAGTGRAAFLGCLKVTTIFTFAFFSLVAAPRYWFAEDQTSWVALGVFVSGVIPLVFVAYITSPFVANIQLHLPTAARVTRDSFNRWLRSSPKDMKLDLTTINLIGMPRIRSVMVADLFPVKERFGLVNYGRDTTTLNSQRRWWMGKILSRFGIHGGAEPAFSPGVWSSIKLLIEKQGR